MNLVQKGIWTLLRHRVAVNSRNCESDDTVKGWGIQINRIDAQNKASSSTFVADFIWVEAKPSDLTSYELSQWSSVGSSALGSLLKHDVL